MANNTLNTVSGAHVIINDDFNQFTTALSGDFVGRDPVTKAPSSAQKLGTATTPWNQAHITNLFLNGALFDPDNLGSAGSRKNTITSGKTRADSEMPDFIRASGNAASLTILATDTDLLYTANNVGTILSADVTISSLQTAPSSNNAALVNDASLAGGLTTKYHGEGVNGQITLDNVGTEITDRARQYVALKHGTSEYMLAFVDEVDTDVNTATITNIYRGFFFDDSGEPLVREVMSDNDTLTLMSLGWVFGQNNGTTFDVSYKSPIWSYNAPASPETDDYWFDLNADVWKRYDGSDFVIVNRMLLGLCVIDSSNCVATRSADFSKSYSAESRITVDGVPLSDTEIQSKSKTSFISVNAGTLKYEASPIVWDIANDLESGITEQTDFLYYLYITEKGDTVFSEERPYDRRNDLKGYYHPYHTWRAVGTALNASGNLISANTAYVASEAQFTRYIDFTASGTFIPGQYDIINNEVMVEVWGAGGGSGFNVGQAGSGGGAGGYAKGIVDITGTTSITITVGFGGAPRVDGGSSSFGNMVIASGGRGGEGGAGAESAEGGSGTAGNYFLAQGSSGQSGGSNTLKAGLGIGGNGNGGTGNGTRVGEGGGVSLGITANGFRGHVRVWY